ncbi:MAG: substrate-binding domain-containing protein [Hormoscilla sp.]
MNKNQQKVRPLFLLIGILLSLNMVAGCRNAKDDDAPWWTAAQGCQNVAILLPEDETERYDKYDRPMLKQEIDKRIPGVTIQYFNAQGVADTQEYQAETALSAGACILVLDPVDGNQAPVIVQAAKQQNVPVIAYDRAILDEDTMFYVSFNNEEVGELQGQYIVAQYQQGGYGLKKGAKLVMIHGSATDNNARLFREGVLKKLQPLIDRGDLQLVFDEYTPYWDGEIAGDRVAEVLAKHNRDIQILYVANDNMANSVIEVLRNYKLNGKVLVTGQDAELFALQNILKGDQAMTVYKPISQEAAATAKLVGALSSGRYPGEIINSTIETATGGKIPAVLVDAIAVDKDNIIDTLLADKFVQLAEICQGITVEPGGICK